MEKLKIYSANQWNFYFEMDNKNEILTDHVFHKCFYCKVTCLSPVYVYIIKSLQEGGLLDENYKLICCFCAVLKEFGMLDIKDYLSRIAYDDVLDTLMLRFQFLSREDQSSVYFYIHDYSKINHWN